MVHLKIDRNRVLQLTWDAIAWILAVPIATILRYEWNPSGTSIANAFRAGVILAILQILISLFMQAVNGRYVIGSFDEIYGVVASALVVTTLFAVVLFFLGGSYLPRTITITSMVFADLIMLGGRFAVRSIRQNGALSKTGQRVLIYGAGDSGEQIVRQMIKDPASEYIPVGFIDDNPSKRNLRIHGFRVLGDFNQLTTIVRRLGVATVVVSIANIDREKLVLIDELCTELEIQLSIIPTTSQLIGGEVRLRDISEITNEDLLGRNPIETDEQAIRKFLEGKRVLITGAGGSIGSEIARQIYKYQPSYLGILDRDESAIHEVQLTIEGEGLLDSEGLILADIRDEVKMLELFNEIKPQVVFHAAALKHLTLLERYPMEAYKTNVLGTLNVLRAAEKSGVDVFINISTDKAAEPSSILGKSKLVTERLTSYFSQNSGRKFLSVRFGNVLGSRGSVLTAFRYQIAKGGPVTVTHPDVTRYFMTIPEAVHLVLQAAVIGEPSETLILDMGHPVKIVDVAKQLIDKSGKQIEIVFTGLRPGEKLDEILIGGSESAVKRSHPKISHSKVEPLADYLLSPEEFNHS
jgi:FlaA1/EpsC-like NDP-sugar epimerase